MKNDFDYYVKRLEDIPHGDTGMDSNITDPVFRNFLSENSSITPDSEKLKRFIDDAYAAWKPDQTSYEVLKLWDEAERSLGFGICNRHGAYEFYPKIFRNVFPEARYEAGDQVVP